MSRKARLARAGLSWEAKYRNISTVIPAVLTFNRAEDLAPAQKKEAPLFRAEPPGPLGVDGMKEKRRPQGRAKLGVSGKRAATIGVKALCHSPIGAASFEKLAP